MVAVLTLAISSGCQTTGTTLASVKESISNGASAASDKVSSMRKTKPKPYYYKPPIGLDEPTKEALDSCVTELNTERSQNGKPQIVLGERPADPHAATKASAVVGGSLALGLLASPAVLLGAGVAGSGAAIQRMHTVQVDHTHGEIWACIKRTRGH